MLLFAFLFHVRVAEHSVGIRSGFFGGGAIIHESYVLTGSYFGASSFLFVRSND